MTKYIQRNLLSKNSDIYNKVMTFNELCNIGCEFIQNKIKVHPFLIVDETKDNLYELVGEKYEWIRYYLIKYNSMGFYTVMSQPGNDYPVQIYPNTLEYKKSFEYEKNINGLNDINKFGVKQRAQVEGFMKLDKAKKLFDKLKNDPEIKIIISHTDNIITNSLDNYTTLSYERITINNLNQIRFMEMEAEYNEKIRNELKGFDRNYKLEKLKHVIRRYFCVRNYKLNKHIPNLIDQDIIGINIMDLTWNRNDYLWEKIYFTLKEIS